MEELKTRQVESVGFTKKIDTIELRQRHTEQVLAQTTEERNALLEEVATLRAERDRKSVLFSWCLVLELIFFVLSSSSSSSY